MLDMKWLVWVWTDQTPLNLNLPIIFKEFFQSIAEPFGIFDKFSLSLL